MNKNKTENDWLDTLFGRLPEASLPASFREATMRRIWKEAEKAKKRNEYLGLLFLVVASLFITGLAVAAIRYMGVPHIEWEFPKYESVMPFYLYIGVLALFLLGIDHLFRRMYKKKHP